MNIQSNPRAVAHTGWDGIERHYLSLTIPELKAGAAKLIVCDPDDPFVSFLAASVHEGDAPPPPNSIIEFIAPMVTEAHCSIPLSRDEMENGMHFDINDIKALVGIALGKR